MIFLDLWLQLTGYDTQPHAYSLDELRKPALKTLDLFNVTDSRGDAYSTYMLLHKHTLGSVNGWSPFRRQVIM